VAVVSSYRYRVHFEDDRDAMANYVGDVLQVGGDITFEGRPGVITDAKAEGATRIYYPHATRRPAHRCPYVAPPPSRFAGTATGAALEEGDTRAALQLIGLLPDSRRR
jgi:hypothetical protein